MKKRLLSILVFGFISLALQGQARLAIVPGSIRYDSTTAFGKHLSLHYSVINIGDSAYSGEVFLNMKTSRAIRNNVDTISSRMYIPGDSAISSFSVEVAKTVFDPGENIVVIWPTGTKFISDSSSIKVKVLYGAGINAEKIDVAQVRIYPNPGSDYLWISHNGIEILKTSVIDLKGRLIFSQEGNLSSLEISSLPPGNYILQLFSSKGDLSSYTFIKE